MGVKVTLALCAFVALFGSGASAAYRHEMPTAMRRDQPTGDFQDVLQDVEEICSELYRIVGLTSELVFLIPIKGTRLIGLEMLTLIHNMKDAFTDVKTGVRDIAEVTGRGGLSGVLFEGTELLLYVTRTIRKILQQVKKYVENI